MATGRVAIDCGADAVYVGGPSFGARRSAGNSADDVAALVRYAKPFGVRVYATMNTLLFDDELADAQNVANSLIDAGVDALIVQDMAFARMNLAGVELHASTQTSNLRPEDVEFLARAGFRRVILERALSLDEIRAATAAATLQDTDTEVFIHGAICVGHSGRCFLSRALDGSRSGNRGDCAQSCRLAWDLVDGTGAVIGDDSAAVSSSSFGSGSGMGGIPIIKGKHLLSVRDLDLGAHIGELLDAGVTSFKIEGRLKDTAYVRNVVSYYRRLIDNELALRPRLRRASIGDSRPDFEPNPAKSFTRGASDYFFAGPRSGVASFDTPKAIGEPVGKIAAVGCERTGNHYFTLAYSSDFSRYAMLAAGDGICFFAGGELRGTNVNRVDGGRVYIAKSEGLKAGVEVFRNHDHIFARQLESSRMRRRITAHAVVETHHERVSVTVTDETGLAVCVARDGQFEPARDPQKMADVVRGEIARSGDTSFDIQRVTIVGDSLFIPVSVLAQLRREALTALFDARIKLAPERYPAIEDHSAIAPRTHLGADENVTNHLAERFWRDHGVTQIDQSIEIRGAQAGDQLMRTRYCIRREIGQCLRCGGDSGEKNGASSEKNPVSNEKISASGKLFLVRGGVRLALEFDCKNCEMTITKI